MPHDAKCPTTRDGIVRESPAAKWPTTSRRHFAEVESRGMLLHGKQLPGTVDAFPPLLRTQLSLVSGTFPFASEWRL